MTPKNILCVALLIFTSGIGYSFSLKYRKRKQFFSQLYEFNEKFLQELSYSRRPLVEFVQNSYYKGDFSELLSIFLTSTSEDMSFKEFFSSITFLKAEEEREIAQFFNDLGRGDSEAQKKVFSNRLKELSQKKSEVYADYKKYAELYVKLGVLVGISIIIIIL